MTATTAVIDTSAVVAILLGEAGHRDLITYLNDRPRLLMAAPTRLEAAIVLEGRKGPSSAVALTALLRDTAVEIVAFDNSLTERALEGWRRYGKGNHPAALNLGDCFTYALASDLNVPIICTGNDFVHTDLDVIRPVQD